ncbi:hypothetical protein LEP1GSC188_1325 [Leptospira weilii serovar Topaz str. LT2116]|uniref:Uncharacterized protein n=1 Tax=Leptospira weilii serovar Topaz str. LT2116 TaxID=1088540 RepID=M3GCK5_9LEPT|nr:hypothetical protein LEP1GSC188_1325 [Leptospira weilii serovar Topaz str. LT2116]
MYFVLKKAKAEFNPETGLEIAKEEYKEIERQMKQWEGDDPFRSLPQQKPADSAYIIEQELKHLNIQLVKYNDIIKDLESILEDRK